jgi:hypothetical protein
MMQNQSKQPASKFMYVSKITRDQSDGKFKSNQIARKLKDKIMNRFTEFVIFETLNRLILIQTIEIRVEKCRCTDNQLYELPKTDSCHPIATFSLS